MISTRQNYPAESEETNSQENLFNQGYYHPNKEDFDGIRQRSSGNVNVFFKRPATPPTKDVELKVDENVTSLSKP